MAIATKNIGLIWLVFYLSLTGVHAQNHPKIDSIFEPWKSESSPGGAVVVVDHEKVTYIKAFGLASLEYDVPITTKTIFNIASVSKQFTAFSIVLLAQQGKLTLEDDIRKFVPEVPDFGTTITIRHLLNHTSGLRNFQNLLTMAGWRDGDAMSNDDLLKYIKWQKDLNFPVGSEYLYCNTGYNLMATVIERVSGQSFIEWTSENIFKPLGMEHSIFRNDMTEVVKNMATSYDGNLEGGFTAPRPFWDYMGNGNLYTTVEDLAKWIANFSSHNLGGKDGFGQLTTRGILTNGDTISYALGIGVGSYRGLRVIQHGGSIGGYRSSLAFFPDQNIGIAVLSNFSDSNSSGKLWEVAEIYLEAHFDNPAVKTSSKRMFDRVPYQMGENDLLDFAGYFDMDNFTAEFIMENGGLKVKASGSPPLDVIPSSDSTFYVEAINVDMVFRRDKNGVVDRIVAYDPDPIHGIKLDLSLQQAEHLPQYLGTYYSPELKTSYNVDLRNNQLIVSHPRHESFSLLPISIDDLKGEAWFFNDVKVKRNGVGEITGLLVSNGRVRNLWFEKRGL